MMELLLNTQEERCRIQVYNEYLKKIPQLLQQLEVVETMYEKAVMEEAMLPEEGKRDWSAQQYAQRPEGRDLPHLEVQRIPEVDRLPAKPFHHFMTTR